MRDSVLESSPERHAGASSNTKCAFVPPIPNELTAALRGVPLTSQDLREVLTQNGLCAKSIFGFGVSKLTTGKICRYLRERTDFIKPATPAAASRCPKFDFIEPMPQ